MASSAQLRSSIRTQLTLYTDTAQTGFTESTRCASRQSIVARSKDLKHRDNPDHLNYLQDKVFYH